MKAKPSAQWVLVSMTLAAFSAAIAMTSIAVAVPAISRQWALAQNHVHWAFSGFLLAMVPAMAISPWLLARFGERATYYGALAALIAGGIYGSLAPNFSALVASRVLGGIAAGVLQPLPVIAISRRFQAGKRGLTMGIFTLGAVLAPTIAPAIGGALVDHIGWRAVPLAALPFAVLAAASARWLSPREHDADSENPNLLGSLRIGLVARPEFRRSCTVAFLYGAAMFASVYLVPIFIQLALHRPATAAGAVLVPAGLALAIASPFGGRLADIWPRHRVIALGLLTFGVAHVSLLTLDAHSSLVPLMLLMIIARLGMAMVLPSLSLNALHDLSEKDWTSGSSLVSLARQAGAVFGVGAGAVLLQWRMEIRASHVESAALSAFHEAFVFVALTCAVAAMVAWRKYSFR